MKCLSDLLTVVEGFTIGSLPCDPEITGIAGCIQDCKPGALFIADVSEVTDKTRTYEYLDGADFIPQAIEAGVSVVLTRPDVDLPNEYKNRALLLHHPNPLKCLGPIAAHFYEHKAPNFVGAVTGTNGKTSTVNFIAQLFGLAGKEAISMGNMGVRDSRSQLIEELPNRLSTPETVDMHRRLLNLHGQGIKGVFTEASSHALHDYRLHGVNLYAAAITNITQDHLDFHGSMENYLREKMKLFTEVLPSGSIAILNADMDYFKEIRSACEARNHTIIEYGKNAKDIKLLSTQSTPDGLIIRLSWNGAAHEEIVPITGEFQAYNILCALALADAAELDMETLIPLLPRLCSIEARMELIGKTPKGGDIYIDYAHTPDALQQALQTLHNIKQKRIITVISCDGERDQDKRHQMGQIAERYSDLVFVTDGVPRSEEPSLIRQHILSQCQNIKAIQDIEGRIAAIKEAVAATQDGDILLLAGIGAEPWPDCANNNKKTTDAEALLHIFSTHK